MTQQRVLFPELKRMERAAQIIEQCDRAASVNKVLPDLMHHGGNPESEAAHKTANKFHMRRLVFGTIQAWGTAIPDEIAAHYGFTINAVAPRCTELLALGLIERTGEKRKTRYGKWSAVLRVKG